MKGAPEAVLPRLAEPAPELERRAESWSEEGIRVLLVARAGRHRAATIPSASSLPLGLVGLADPPRSSAAPAVAAARRAGIRTVMITGDHPRTAAAVARACGIGGTAPHVMTGMELDRLSDDELRERVGGVDVFARAVPAHKLRIVAALQARGDAVAMTGDGVNDAPALAAADVGVAMGRGGSDAAIEAADIVLTDNDFATIVAAIEGGRTVYRNIVRFIRFLLAANTGEVLVFALAIALGALGAADGAADPARQPAHRRAAGAGARRRPARPRRPAPAARGRLRGHPAPDRRHVRRRRAHRTRPFASFLIGREDGDRSRRRCASRRCCSRSSPTCSRSRRGRSCARPQPVLVAAVFGSAAIGAAVLAIPALRRGAARPGAARGRAGARAGPVRGHGKRQGDPPAA